MGEGRSEQGKDAIAQGLRHIALIAMYGVHHKLQSGIDNRSGFFGIESFDQGGGAFKIGKERGDGFTFTFGYCCCTNPVGQMRRCVGKT